MDGEQFRFEVHPVAALFPMLGDDELTDLAADIRANGLRHPIMLDAAGRVLIDGRNRLEACRRAEVEPSFERLAKGVDPVAYIWSVNIARRHMTKGQIAMSAARMRSVSEQTQRQTAKLTRVSNGRIAQADTVLQFAPELADEVMSGATPLDAAYATATRRKQEASGTEAQMNRLREAAPDLADLVIEERMSLGEATAAAHQRVAEREQAIDAGRRAAELTVPQFCSGVLTIAAATELGALGLVTEDHLKRAGGALALLEKLYGGQQ